MRNSIEILRKKRNELRVKLVDAENKHGGLLKSLGAFNLEAFLLSEEIEKLDALISREEKASINEVMANEVTVVDVDSDSCEKVLILLGGVLSCIKGRGGKKITQDYLSTAFSETIAANKLRMKKRTVDELFARAVEEFREKTDS